MRDKALACAVVAVSLSACAHNDVLVFGTDSSFGIDVQTAATQGASPSITVGYKRKEAVWMPLIVNATHSKVAAGQAVTWNPDGVKYASTVPGADGKDRRDTYSVFASLGARFDNEINAGGGKVGGGLAQFFATGRAAVALTENEALVTSLKLSDGESATAQATAVTAAATNKSATAISSGLTPDQTAALEAAAAKLIALHDRRVNLVLACATGADGAYRWEEIVAGTDYAEGEKTAYKGFAKANLAAKLKENPALTKKALTAGVAAFNCAGE